MSKTPGGAEAAPPQGADDALSSAHAALLQDNQLQFHFAQPPPRPDPPAWLEPIARLLSALAPFLQYLFWGGVIVIAGFVLYTLINEIMRRMPVRAHKQQAAPEEERVYKPTAAHARALLEEADRLAAEGRYGEAVRVLLHRSVEDLERVFALAIGPALTSREIARLPPLSEEGRSVFSGIAAAVEMSLFGGQPLEAARFRACREAYATFASQGGRR